MVKFTCSSQESLQEKFSGKVFRKSSQESPLRERSGDINLAVPVPLISCLAIALFNSSRICIRTLRIAIVTLWSSYYEIFTMKILLWVYEL